MDLSKLNPKDQAAEQTKRILRVNANAPMHLVRAAKNSAPYVRGGKVINPVMPGQATPRTFTHVKDGEAYDNAYLCLEEKVYGQSPMFHVNVRAGAEDFLKVPSVSPFKEH